MLSLVKATSAQSQLVELLVRSERLAHNPANITADRPLTVYLPRQAAEDSQARFPVLYCLAPWTSAGRGQFGWQAFKESLKDRLDRLIAAEEIPPVVVVCPDLYTYFGGSQYINSDFLGAHGDFLVDELLPFVEEHFPVKKGAPWRAVFGRSSGGYGALRLAIDYPGAFAAIACHSADLGFDTVFRRDLIDLCNGLQRYVDDLEAYIEHCRQAPKLAGRDVHLMMLLGLCASYSPNPHRPEGFDLPVDLKTGRLLPSVWQQWLSHDPVEMLEHPQVREALRQLRCFYLECGNRDQFHLHYGARQLRQKLDQYQISHIYREFDDNHSGTAYRYDVSLPLLCAALGDSAKP